MFLFKKSLFSTNRLLHSTRSVAHSANRIIHFHNLYTAVDPGEEQPLRAAFRRELRILFKRAFKLYAYLVLYMKKPEEDARFP